MTQTMTSEQEQILSTLKSLPTPPSPDEILRAVELLRSGGGEGGEAYLCNVGSGEFRDTNLADRREYHLLPADETKGYSVITIYSSTQKSISGVQSPQDPRIIHISGREYAEGLVSIWGATSMLSGLPRGIGIISGPVPTAAELAELRAKETARCRQLVAFADTYYTSGDPKQRLKILDEHRRAGTWLKLDPTQHAWLIPTQVELTIPGGCPACTKPMSAQAYVCPSCRTDVAQHFLDRDQFPDPAKFPGVVEEMAFRRKRVAAASAQSPAPNKKSSTSPPVNID